MHHCHYYRNIFFIYTVKIDFHEHLDGLSVPKCLLKSVLLHVGRTNACETSCGCSSRLTAKKKFPQKIIQNPSSSRAGSCHRSRAQGLSSPSQMPSPTPIAASDPCVWEGESPSDPLPLSSPSPDPLLMCFPSGLVGGKLWFDVLDVYSRPQLVLHVSQLKLACYFEQAKTPARLVRKTQRAKSSLVELVTSQAKSSWSRVE